MAVPIKKWLDKIPGGIIIVPLFLGCLINTFFPAALQIGSFTTGIVNGTSALVGIFFVCMGAQLDLKCFSGLSPGRLRRASWLQEQLVMRNEKLLSLGWRGGLHDPETNMNVAI